MIKTTSGNLLQAEVEALVNTVNCVGVMGKGVALQFRQAFPENYKKYQDACKKKQVVPGKMFVFETGKLLGPKFIINFPTKRHWKGKSRLVDIQQGLTALVETIRKLNIRSIAIPPLGCGNGGLDWNSIEPLIKRQLAVLPDIEVLLFSPLGAPDPRAMKVATKKPLMTRGRALLISMLDNYSAMGYRRTMLEVQKLAYFLQEAGESLKLKFTKYLLGPYAENLHHVLQHLEGHYIRGYGDRTNRAEIELLPGAREEAAAFLSTDPDAKERIRAVTELIEGFETPYGMELLATTHWVVRDNPTAADDFAAVLEGFSKWNSRKKTVFKPDHVRKAWLRLRNLDWFSSSGSSHTKSINDDKKIISELRQLETR